MTHQEKLFKLLSEWFGDSILPENNVAIYLDNETGQILKAVVKYTIKPSNNNGTVTYEVAPDKKVIPN